MRRLAGRRDRDRRRYRRPRRPARRLRTAAARPACVADARSADAYAALLRDAGCEPLAIEPHDAELRAMADRVEARLRVAPCWRRPGDQRERIREAAALAPLAIDAIARESLGYALITARVRRS